MPAALRFGRRRTYATCVAFAWHFCGTSGTWNRGPGGEEGPAASQEAVEAYRALAAALWVPINPSMLVKQRDCMTLDVIPEHDRVVFG